MRAIEMAPFVCRSLFIMLLVLVSSISSGLRPSASVPDLTRSANPNALGTLQDANEPVGYLLERKIFCPGGLESIPFSLGAIYQLCRHSPMFTIHTITAAGLWDNRRDKELAESTTASIKAARSNSPKLYAPESDTELFMVPAEDFNKPADWSSVFVAGNRVVATKRLWKVWKIVEQRVRGYCIKYRFQLKIYTGKFPFLQSPLPNTKETYDIHVMVKIIINKDTNYGRRTAIVATDNENGVFPGQFRHLFPNEESKRKACAFLELPADVAADVICFDADRFMEFFPQYSQVKQRSRFHGMFRTNHHRVYED